MTSLFISDLHLDPLQPEIIDRFLSLLNTRAACAEALFILGDLFELWIGDDYIPPGLQPVVRGLRALSDKGIRIGIVPGNRDFLLGDTFAKLAGCDYPGDPFMIELAGESAVVCHGDILCTDDLPYQQFRRMVRAPEWQREFLEKPVEQRLQLARAARNMSAESTRNQSESIMDVNADAVSKLMQETGATLLVHGHTHRPAIHRLDAGGRRIVLGDWPDRATMLVAEESGLALRAVDG